MHAITVWSAFNGNVEQRKDEGVGEGERWSPAPQVSVKDVCVLGASLPLCGARWFGGQVIHDSGDPWDLLDLIYHLQHHLHTPRRKTLNYSIGGGPSGGGGFAMYLFWDMVARRSGDASHKIAGDEGANHHRAPAGRLLLQRVPVKVQRGQDDGHLADLPRIT